MKTPPRSSSGLDCSSTDKTDLVFGGISLAPELISKGKVKVNGDEDFSSQIQTSKPSPFDSKKIDMEEGEMSDREEDAPPESFNQCTVSMETEQINTKETELFDEKSCEIVSEVVDIVKECDEIVYDVEDGTENESEEPEYIQLNEDMEDEFLFKSDESLPENDSPIQFFAEEIYKPPINITSSDSFSFSQASYLVSRVFASVRVKREQILQGLPDTHLVIYIHEDSTDSFQLTELFDLVGQNARYISYEKLVSKNLDFEWHELHQLKTNVIMSKICLFSALYHGLLGISQISSIFVENLEVFEALVNVFKDILLPIKSLPPVFGIRLQDSTFFQTFKASFHLHPGLQNYSIPAALLKENFQRLSDLENLKEEHKAIYSSLGNWAANLFLSHEFKKTHKKMNILQEEMSSEEFSQINDFLNDVQARLQAELDVSLFQPGTQPQYAPIQHLWGLLRNELQSGRDLKFIILVPHQAIIIYLVELLRKLTHSVPKCKVYSGYSPHSDQGMCVSVCTREAFVAKEKSCIVYSLDCLNSLVQYFCLRSQLESLSCQLVVYSCSSNPINSYIQELERMASTATFVQLHPEYTRTNAYRVHFAESGATLTLSSAALFLTEACETPRLSGRDFSTYSIQTIKQGGMFFCTITFASSTPLYTFSGTPQKTQILARQIAIWEACVRLQRACILDSRFLP